MIQPEIVAPAGNFKKLKIALAYGADAVYAGVSNFSLRARTARDFNYDTFQEAIEYTHNKGKKIYVTINGFHFSSQIEGLKKHILKLKDMKPDAFIVASVGAMRLVRELAPDINLHVSTQANILNYLDAQVYKDMGTKRVVIARELGLKDAKELKNHCDVELESFVHGSMCFAYSGRCLISSVQSGRMSNRGSCANDCRFSYELYAKNPETNTLFRLEEDQQGTHIFNSKDLNLSSYIQKIMQEDCINAFKIEGRTKSEYYVALTTRTYKMAVNDVLNNSFEVDKYESEIQTLKNRGFTDGYLVSRAYEKKDSINHDTSIEEGTHQVHAISEDGEFFKCKGKVKIGQEYEILSPVNSHIEIGENKLGAVYEKNGKKFVIFKQLLAKNNKEFDEIHSGNENEISLPFKFPDYSFLRKSIE
ncbi:peptidase U32 family protein [Campylobacter insulaenigrae]|uniref:Collagenase-like peptidase, U32 family n=1 Tax=Campylobacter insulaenigrae NCTC 12927 TaxID=1031564 RepID=A0A0A8H1U0_9BACT|nr:peptidase U32 family protein [Campylobacter insulaenigrae]AJC87932.1 collagenase-like peptidase, U32 family [Campylobacter insulaenigrae NCTC 12927]MCR6590883.1 U32 family peptidase [Campylobacter insulaenigrae]MCR6592560.1 U32 family peptidase [Campylobacter insulaenigrae]VEH94413.1 peptidase U32 [Campylobacter insulaenigrae]VEJ54125.1 peptidase U32 [Campylobacter insulaenigrae]